MNPEEWRLYTGSGQVIKESQNRTYQKTSMKGFKGENEIIR